MNFPTDAMLPAVDENGDLMPGFQPLGFSESANYQGFPYEFNADGRRYTTAEVEFWGVCLLSEIFQMALGIEDNQVRTPEYFFEGYGECPVKGVAA